eukprot:6578649-Pyramimonas_sp.AAC.2
MALATLRVSLLLSRLYNCITTTVTTVVATASHYTLYNYNTLPRRFLYRTLASHACVCALA